MRKSMKLSISLLLIVSILCALSVNCFAVAMTKDSLQTNISAYVTGSKTASATVDGGETTIGGQSGLTVSVDDSTITVTNNGVNMVANYSISDASTTFSITQNYTSDISDENYTLELAKPSAMLSMCFLAVTDAQSVDSNKALEYYLKAVSAGTTTGQISDASNKLESAKATKISVNDDIFTYSQTEEKNTDTEYSVTNTLVINMSSDFSKIGSSGGEIVADTNETPANEIAPANEIVSTNEAEEPTNEIFNSNNTSEEDLPNTGPEVWIQFAIVLVAVVIIFIMLMNILTTKRLRNGQ